MKIVLIALYNYHSYAIRGFHSLLLQLGYEDVESMYFAESTYTDRHPTHSDLASFVGVLKSKSPDFVAISVHSPVFQVFKQLSTMIRESMPLVKIVVGGEHPTACPDDCLPYADSVVVGEGEPAIVELMRGDLLEGINGPYDLIQDLDALPRGYYGAGTWGNTLKPPVISAYMTGRGCPYTCTYCQESLRREIYGPAYAKWRRKSVAKVMDDLEYFRAVHGMTSVFFSDPIFTTDKIWLEEFCSEFERLSMKFGCYGHSAGLTRETILILKSAGLGNFRMGVQSGSSDIRAKLFNRKDTLDGILNAAWLIHDCKLVGTYDFIVNNPYDTPKTLQETRDFIGKLPPHSGINNFELRWFPGVPLTEMALSDGHIKARDVEGQFTRLGSWNYYYRKGV